MNTNCGKEKLTHTIIKKDLLNQAIIDMVLGYIQIPFYLIITYLLPTFFRHAPFYMIITKLCWITFIVIFLIINISTIPIIIKISKDQFILKTDILHKKRDFIGAGFSAGAKLVFLHYGHFHISRRYGYYKWSHAFSMSRQDLFESSRLNDRFVLATVGKKILMVYNDKFFDTTFIKYSNNIH